MDRPLSERREQLEKRKEEAYHAGSERAVERQHSRGKLTARERVDYLLDEGSFVELDMLARSRNPELDEKPFTDGVVTGWVFAEKVHKVMDMAASVGAPFIGLNDGAGARIQEGVVSLAMYGGIFLRNVNSSGVIPQISVIMGPCAGGAVYSPALTDFLFMVQETSYMFITGPDVVKSVTGEDVTQQELGGAMSHATRSGLACYTSPDERSCLDDVRYLLSFLPSNNMEEPPWVQPTDDPERTTPEMCRVRTSSGQAPLPATRSIVAASGARESSRRNSAAAALAVRR